MWVTTPCRRRRVSEQFPAAGRPAPLPSPLLTRTAEKSILHAMPVHCGPRCARLPRPIPSLCRVAEHWILQSPSTFLTTQPPVLTTSYLARTIQKAAPAIPLPSPSPLRRILFSPQPPQARPLLRGKAREPATCPYLQWAAHSLLR